MTECCNPTAAAHSACPRCGRLGKAVEVVTLKSLLTPDAMTRLEPSANYQFCRTADCPVVYFNGAQTFTTDEVTVRVFQKDNTDALPVCYCFGFTRERIADELNRTRKSTAVQQVTRYVQDGKCACEIRNPQGSCCLGNLRQVAAQTRRTLGIDAR